MNAVIPTPEVSDSDFGAFAEAADAEKARAAKHYPALAAEAAAMFKPDARNPWEAHNTTNVTPERSMSVIGDTMGHVRVHVTTTCVSVGVYMTPAEARALAAELVKAAEALA